MRIAHPQPSEPEKTWRDDLVVLGLILVLAVVLRSAWLLAFNVDPGDGREDDSRFYHGVAQALSDWGGYEDPATGQTTAQWPPGYSATLAPAYAVPGDNVLTAKAANVALALVSVVLVYLLAGRLFGRRAGLIAALLLAAFPSYVFLSTLVFSENLFVPAVLLVMTLVAWWALSGQPPAALQSLALGAAIGFSAMVRAEGIWLLAPVGAVWLLASRDWRRALRNGVFVAAGLAILLAPWTVRNAIQLDEYTPLRSASSGVLQIGLNPEYRRYGPIPPAVPLPSVRDDLRYYAEHPWRGLTFLRDKAHDLYENDSALLYYVDLDAYRTWHGLADGVYYGLGLVALAGLALLLLARDRGGFLLAGVLLTWTLGMALVVPEPRYHAVLMPLLVILAAVAISRVPAALESRSGRASRVVPLLPAAALLAGVAVAVTTISVTRGDEVIIPVRRPVALEASPGEMIRLGALEVTLRDVMVQESNAGVTEVTVDLLVRNAGLAAVVVFEAQATVEDDEGNQYPPSIPDPNLPLTADLAPGAVLEGSAAYSVPSAAEGLEFVYTPLGIGVQGRWPLE
jgi:4-amino-4-deoxy-L-arabinose transferase-like glycosyltransferase